MSMRRRRTIISDLKYSMSSKAWYTNTDRTFRLETGNLVVLETKGQDTDQDKSKRAFLDEWVKAVNEHGGFGKWQCGVSKNPADVARILEKAVNSM